MPKTNLPSVIFLTKYSVLLLVCYSRNADSGRYEPLRVKYKLMGTCVPKQPHNDQLLPPPGHTTVHNNPNMIVWGFCKTLEEFHLKVLLFFWKFKILTNLDVVQVKNNWDPPSGSDNESI